jgi:branched-chain amino acid transport system substrate-binding protein
LAENFQAQFKARGGNIVSNEAYQTEDKDFNAQITRIRTTNPGLVFLPDYYGTVSLIAKQLREQGVNAPLLGGDGWDGLVDNADDTVLNSFYSAHFAADAVDSTVETFVAAYRAKYNNETPTAFAGLGYDSLKLIADGIKAAGSTDSAAVKDAIAKISGKYVTGNIKFDAKRNPIKSAVILEIMKRDGKLVTVYNTTVNP